MKGTLVSSSIAEPYAQALMSLARSRDLAERFGEDFRAIERLMEESPELRDFITNPIVKDEDKKAVIRRIMGEDTDSQLVNFLMLLVDKRRIIFLEQVADQYLTLLREMNQVVLAEVISTRELNEDQRRSVEDKVREISHARGVELKTTINPDIIGGVIIKVGSQVLDASLRSQLRRIGMSLNA
ncbi:ATP synthase F1 subunit delta [Spirulina sp. 06S082]|uniref:ATP synthase F1 subunit delta n=1 Tax=Spirulina sp. 06S082 TaxID=3110248 RepID=UPI002B1F2419|nr:ATP synthase F1 subunit delta [Spirulina sp. 06S082]MEA5468324.1 ATP synthase F1 subunit delta [Spirulina sp. 06S082]